MFIAEGRYVLLDEGLEALHNGAKILGTNRLDYHLHTSPHIVSIEQTIVIICFLERKCDKVM